MTSAYLLTLEGAKMLLKKAFPLRMPADALTEEPTSPESEPMGYIQKLQLLQVLKVGIWGREISSHVNDGSTKSSKDPKVIFYKNLARQHYPRSKFNY